MTDTELRALLRTVRQNRPETSTLMAVGEMADEIRRLWRLLAWAETDFGLRSASPKRKDEPDDPGGHPPPRPGSIRRILPAVLLGVCVFSDQMARHGVIGLL